MADPWSAELQDPEGPKQHTKLPVVMGEPKTAAREIDKRFATVRSAVVMGAAADKVADEKQAIELRVGAEAKANAALRSYTGATLHVVTQIFQLIVTRQGFKKKFLEVSLAG